MYAPALDDEFAREVRSGLGRSGQKTLPCQYLYDDLGSALFEAITCLPEYGLTRADARVIEAHAGDLADCLPSNMLVAELGSGTGTKTRAIVGALAEREDVSYYPIDVSRAALEKCAVDLSTRAKVFPIEATYLEGLRQVSARRREGQTLLVLFLGSTIGNFEPDAAINLLYGARVLLRPGDALLLGTDLVKPIDVLRAAYDDPTGVTAAFNMNLLGRINRELDGDFHLRRWEHMVRYDAKAQRIEMHLRSRARQKVTVQAADLTVHFESGETIFTEACHKFRPEQICTMARTSGFRMQEQWVDSLWPFAESLLVAV